MNYHILYGTESGNAELVADDLAEKLRADGADVAVTELRDCDPSSLTSESFYLVVCSTHGDGEIPSSVEPFVESFDTAQPDLAGVHYAMFGLGDRVYEATYSQGSEHIDRRFAAQGAVRLGEYGRHDASSWDVPSDVALEWLTSVRNVFAAMEHGDA